MYSEKNNLRINLWGITIRIVTKLRHKAAQRLVVHAASAAERHAPFGRGSSAWGRDFGTKKSVQ